MDFLDELLKYVFLFKAAVRSLTITLLQNEDGLYQIMMMIDVRSITDGRFYFLIVDVNSPSRIMA